MAGAAPAHHASEQSFLAHAQQAASAHGYQLDSAQLRACHELERLYTQLIEREQNGRSLLRLFRRERAPRGVYFWGGVGRGKTFLMDVFFTSIPLLRKRRVHFHRFMQDIHQRLRALQGQTDPLRIVGRELAEHSQLLCLDEFHVTDIGDAMIMRNLLEALFDHQVVLVTTANWSPDRLYEHGLQRAQFVPAIELIKQRMSIVNIESGTDYRLLMLEKGGVFHTPADAQAEVAMLQTFTDVAGEPGEVGVGIEIENRDIHALRLSGGVAWFDFGAICDGPRGQADYIELSRRFHTVLISNVPCFGRENDNARRRFTWLVDEFYDRRVKLVLTAEASVTSLFEQALGGPEKERTESRLIEMQTRRYLSEPHLP